MRLIPRAASKLYANLFGYFWVPCPVCGVEFGGHEWLDVAGHMAAIPAKGSWTGTRRGICPDCTAAGEGCRALAAVGMYHEGCQFVTVPDVGSV